MEECKKIDFEAFENCLGKCVNLEMLSLCGLRIGDAIANELLSLTQLYSVNMGGTSIGSKVFTALASTCTDLEFVYLTGTRADGAAIDTALSQMEQIVHLDVASCLRLRSFNFLTVLTNIVHLDLTRVIAFDDDEAHALVQLTELETLILSRTEVTHEAILHLASLSKLHTLELTYCDLDDRVGPPLRALAGSLECLSLQYTKVSDSMLHVGVESLYKLHTLKLTCCEHFTSFGVRLLSESTLASSLRVLALGSEDIDDTCVESFASFQNLTSLRMWHTSMTPHAANRVGELCKLNYDDTMKSTEGTYLYSE